LALVAILVCTALILVNALYVAAEFASIGVRRARIQQMAADGHPLARFLLPVLQSPASLDRYISACQIGITLSSLGLGAYAQSTFASLVDAVLRSRLAACRTSPRSRRPLPSSCCC
jgi:CBS domain containing-hemolysin-like protein